MSPTVKVLTSHCGSAAEIPKAEWIITSRPDESRDDRTSCPVLDPDEAWCGGESHNECA